LPNYAILFYFKSPDFSIGGSGQMGILGGREGNWGGLWNFLGLNFGFLDAIYWSVFLAFEKKAIGFFFLLNLAIWIVFKMVKLLFLFLLLFFSFLFFLLSSSHIWPDFSEKLPDFCIEWVLVCSQFFKGCFNFFYFHILPLAKFG